MTDDEIIRMARMRTEAKLGFYIHASIFVFVMLVLFAINALSTPSKPWSLYPLVGWGLGVAIHGTIAMGVIGSGVKDRMLQAEIARIKHEQSPQT